MQVKSINKNQTELSKNDVTVLFSYETPVAYIVEGGYGFKTDKYWSATTSKHISQFFKRHSVTSISEVSQLRLLEVLS